MPYFLGLCLLLLLSACDLSRPDLSAYQYQPQPIAAGAPGLRVTHFGTTTLLFDDGQTRILIDSFFSRPSDWVQLFFGKISSDPELIQQLLSQAHAQQISAIAVFHSHYDHALDIGAVSRYTGAQILGSESTANIARGEAIPEEKITVVKPGQAYHYGKFSISFLVSKHTPLPGWIEATGLMGEITQPLRQPASLFEYREGLTYAIHIAHPWGTALLKGGALVPGELKGYKADTVFMCVPGLDQLSPAEQQAYFREVVLETGVRRIIPVHWDDFSKPLTTWLTPMPRSAENLEASLEVIFRQQKQHPEIRLGFIPALEPVLLFPG